MKKKVFSTVRAGGKNMKRRTLATILATVTVLGALTGCASGSNADTKEQAADTESEK